MITSRKTLNFFFILFIVISLFTIVSYAAIDAPHNEANSVSCGSCHGQGLLNSPFWGGSMTLDQICLSCHTAPSGPYSEIAAPFAKTHSSENTSENYGIWGFECRNCHDPHYQKQKNYKNTDASTLYLATGTINDCSDNGDGTSTLTYSSIIYKTGWDASKIIDKTVKGGIDKRSALLFPNVKKLGYSYPVTAIDGSTITVKGDATPVYQYITESTFAIMYGQYIKEDITERVCSITTVQTCSDNSDCPPGEECILEVAVKYFEQTGVNSFADGDSTCNGVCEVCHTLTDHYRNDGGAPDQGHANIGGTDGTNCVSCHTHLEGFKASCFACHNYPPIVDSATPPDGLVWILPVTGSTTAGAHDLHANTKNYSCDVCHHNNISEAGKHNTNPRNITLGFYIFDGTYQGGSYDGQSGVNYNTTTTSPVTTVTSTGSKTCSNIYCHSSGQGEGGTMPPVYSSAVWDSPLKCGECHNDNTETADTDHTGVIMSTGSHTKHVSSSGSSILCSTCHSGAGDGTSKHVDNSIDVSISATYGGTYSDTSEPGNGYGSCSNNYCHSNGVASPVYVNPIWGNTASGACGICHGVVAATPPSSASHTRHVGSAGYKYACSKCHDSVVNATADSTTQPTIKDGLHHADQVKDVAFDAFNNGGSYSGGNCNDIYCHSKGTGATSNPGDTRPITISDSPSWSDTITCGSCHGGGNANGQPEYANGSPKTNSHAKHSTDCSICHYGTTTTGSTITDLTKHVNKLYDLQQKAGYSFSYLYNVNGGSCSNISCHYNGNAQWGTTLSCSSCHGFPPATNAHLAHVQAAVTQVYGSTAVQSTPGSYAFGCGNCHPTNQSLHANGSVNISLDPADGGILKSKNDATAYRNGVGGATVCYKIYCHSNGASGTGSNLATAASSAWGSPLTGNKCGGCHGNPPQYASAGAGIAGANSHYNTSGFMGKEGGHMVTIHFDNIYNKVAVNGLLATGTTVDSSHGNATVATTMACYVCHYGVISSTTIDTYAMDGTGSSFRCGACHTGATPTPLQAGVIADKSQHVGGSVSVAFAPITMKSKAQLRTTSLPAGWTRSGTYGTSGSYDSASAALDSGTWTPATKTCTVACHNGVMIQWGDTEATCLNCHDRL